MRGLIPLYVGSSIQAMVLVKTQDYSNETDKAGMSWWKIFLIKSGMFLLSTVASHPFYVLAARVQYSIFYPTHELQDAFRNTFKANLNLYRKYGVRGYYIGYAPHTFLSAVFFGPYYFTHNVINAEE